MYEKFPTKHTAGSFALLRMTPMMFRTMSTGPMALRSFPFLLFSILALLCSCEKGNDDYRYPSVVTDFVCLTTDATGHLDELHTDHGGRYTLHLTDELLSHNDYQPPTYRRDTVYRAIGVYEPVATAGGDTVAHLYSVGNVTSASPTPLRTGETMHQAPVYLQSCWLSGNYLNMVIEIKGLDMSRHRIGFVDTTPHLMWGQEITFYHEDLGDEEAYRHKLYASIPLHPLAQLLPGSTVRLVINTYDEGMVEYEFRM